MVFPTLHRAMSARLDGIMAVRGVNRLHGRLHVRSVPHKHDPCRFVLLIERVPSTVRRKFILDPQRFHGGKTGWRAQGFARPETGPRRTGRWRTGS